MNTFKRDEIVILLGAGSSKDAGILHSVDMVSEIEGLVSGDWGEYCDLYNYIKSSILFSSGLRGKFSSEVNFNIESIVNTLDELTKKEDHPIYPFVGSWNPKLLEIAGSDFSRLKEFRHKIVEILRSKWISLEYDDDAEYYRGLVVFQEQYEHPLRIFSLNYDLCLESQCGPEILERGFDGRYWEWRLFEMEEKNIYLYKLHGSTDWVREGSRLTYKAEPSQIDHDKAQLIFGTSYKLQYVDPFLFFAHEFRKWTLSSAKLVISIGYGFGDDHINAILGQALDSDSQKILLSVAPLPASTSCEDESSRIEAILRDSGSGQVRCWNMTARTFMQDRLDISALADGLFPEEAEPFHEVFSLEGKRKV